MFKRISHIGIEEPALRGLVDRAMPILTEEIQTWREDVEVEWNASGSPVDSATGQQPTPPGIVLELRLALPNSVGVVRQLLTKDELLDERRLRSAVRDAWSRLLDKLLNQQNERLREHLLQTTEI